MEMVASKSREFKIYDLRRQRQRHKFCIFNEQKQTFARPSRAVIISVHFFPVLGKSVT